MSGDVTARQTSLLPPDVAELTHLVRENVRLLAEITAYFNVSRDPASPNGWTIRRPEDVAVYLGPELVDLVQEQLRVVMLNSKNQVLGVTLVYQGGRNAAVIRLADCFREAVRASAEAIILVHNHPSGDPTPSEADVQLTHHAARAGDLLGIAVLDHVVVGRQGFVSLRQRGLFGPDEPSTGRGNPADRSAAAERGSR